MGIRGERHRKGEEDGKEESRLPDTRDTGIRRFHTYLLRRNRLAPCLESIYRIKVRELGNGSVDGVNNALY